MIVCLSCVVCRGEHMFRCVCMRENDARVGQLYENRRIKRIQKPKCGLNFYFYISRFAMYRSTEWKWETNEYLNIKWNKEKSIVSWLDTGGFIVLVSFHNAIHSSSSNTITIPLCSAAAHSPSRRRFFFYFFASSLYCYLLGICCCNLIFKVDALMACCETRRKTQY